MNKPQSEFSAFVAAFQQVQVNLLEITEMLKRGNPVDVVLDRAPFSLNGSGKAPAILNMKTTCPGHSDLAQYPSPRAVGKANWYLVLFKKGARPT